MQVSVWQTGNILSIHAYKTGSCWQHPIGVTTEDAWRNFEERATVGEEWRGPWSNVSHHPAFTHSAKTHGTELDVAERPKEYQRDGLLGAKSRVYSTAEDSFVLCAKTRLHYIWHRGGTKSRYVLMPLYAISKFWNACLRRLEPLSLYMKFVICSQRLQRVIRLQQYHSWKS